MDFMKLLDFVGLVLMVLGLVGMFIVWWFVVNPVSLFCLGAACYMAPRILMTWFSAGGS